MDDHVVTCEYESAINTADEIQYCYAVIRLGDQLIHRFMVYTFTWAFCADYFRGLQAQAVLPRPRGCRPRWFYNDELHRHLPPNRRGQTEQFVGYLNRQYQEHIDQLAERYLSDIRDEEFEPRLWNA